MGRPSKTTEAQRADIIKALERGASVSDLAKEYGVSRASIIAIRTAHQAEEV